MLNPQIHVLILNWNGYKLTKECVESVYKAKYSNFTISVIDNNSSDNSVEKLKVDFPYLNIITLDFNYGFGKGYNKVFNYLNWQGEYYMLLNNDTIISPNLLEKVAEKIKKMGDKVIYGPKIYYSKDTYQIWYAGGKVNLFLGKIAHIGIRKYEHKFAYKSKTTDYVSGCCLVAHSDVLKQLNGFDEAFNMYSEDVDLCLRAKKLGIKSYFVSSATLYHKVSASMGGELSLKKQLKKFYSFFKLCNSHLLFPLSIFGWIHYVLRQPFRVVSLLANRILS
jgi:hypothetical protein